MKQKLLATTAVLVMIGGLWWQFKGRHSDDTANQPAVETTATGDPAGPDASQPGDFFVDFAGEGDRADGTVNEGSLATDEELNRCRPVQEGYGIEMKSWGKIRLPYGDVWPKNEPGTPVDCSPDSDFGAAVVAAHAVFLDSLSPQLIPQIAADTPGRQLRVDNHTGKTEPEDLASNCEPLGWDKSGNTIWEIYFQCGDGPIKVTPVRMRRVNDDWLMVYEIDGQIRVDDAAPGVAYFPFEGGD